jgi:hypothetical protein
MKIQQKKILDAVENDRALSGRKIAKDENLNLKGVSFVTINNFLNENGL